MPHLLLLPWVVPPLRMVSRLEDTADGEHHRVATLRSVALWVPFPKPRL